MTSASRPWLVLASVLLGGCGVTGSYYVPPVPDAGIGSAKAANCATDFGTQLSGSFGRLDGTVTALVQPSDTQCASATKDALVVEVTANQAVYKVVVDVNNPKSTSGNTDYFFEPITHDPLDAWVEGWHEGGKLDYSAQLQATSASTTWSDLKPADLITKLEGTIALGTKVSVYGTNSGGDETTVHIIHYTGLQTDGTICLDPGGANTWLLFHQDGLIF